MVGSMRHYAQGTEVPHLLGPCRILIADLLRRRWKARMRQTSVSVPMMSVPASVIAGREVDRNSNAVDARRLTGYPSLAHARHAPSRVIRPPRIAVEEVAAADSFRPTSGFAMLRPALKSASADTIATRNTT